MTILLRLTYATAALIILIGLAGTSWGFAQFVLAHPSGLAIILSAVVLGIAVVHLGLQRCSTTRFLMALVAIWIFPRGLTLLLFPNFQLVGDEVYFHAFVQKLGPALRSGNVPVLSNIYDFPVWLSRSFPLYLPLAEMFGPRDLWAARILNALLGAGQLILVFLISEKLLGNRFARLCCLLLLIFPYHCLNVLSYDPQVAGTFFLLLAVWLFLCLNEKRTYSAATLAATAVGFALALLLAGIQRGGIDLLLVFVVFTILLVQTPSQWHWIHPANLAACLLAISLIWLPLRFEFNHWIDSQDQNGLRSHTLGFMTRGWNLVTQGEYLPLYEQLDIASPKLEKQRTLEAVLITEFARQPVRALLVLTPIKIAKFFALGYASTAEQGLSAGGYTTATFVYQCLRVVYAPIILGLSFLGLIRCWRNPNLQRRMFLPVLLIVASCLAIVLIWETSPRYSHPVQFALLVLSTIGAASFSKMKVAQLTQPKLLYSSVPSAAMVVGVWFAFSFVVAAFARGATGYQFLDPRTITANMRQQAMTVESLHPFSPAWEGAIRIPSGTQLPAMVRISFPPPFAGSWDHLSISLWRPDVEPLNHDQYLIHCSTRRRTDDLPDAASGKILRVQIPLQAKDNGELSLLITGAPGCSRTLSEFRVGLGYALLN